MNTNSLYILKSEYYDAIRTIGGNWNDVKDRPVVCLIQSSENKDLYWAIPMGNYNHRDSAGKARLDSYINLPKRDIRSCYYHIGRTTVKSIFFISRAIPVTTKYIEREYFGFDNLPYSISNPKLVEALTYKLNRILKYEYNKPNYFNQHITDMKNFLIQELNNTTSKSLQTV
jgi:hypothetical protein